MSMYATLSDREEEKLDRLTAMLEFLEEERITGYVGNIAYAYDSIGIFLEQVKDITVTPTEEMINFFYNQVVRKCLGKLFTEKNRSGIPSLCHLIVKNKRVSFLKQEWKSQQLTHQD
jgi:predicted type IV restriction endonuclease